MTGTGELSPWATVAPVVDTGVPRRSDCGGCELRSLDGKRDGEGSFSPHGGR